jgi:hypothetical protein
MPFGVLFAYSEGLCITEKLIYHMYNFSNLSQETTTTTTTTTGDCGSTAAINIVVDTV